MQKVIGLSEPCDAWLWATLENTNACYANCHLGMSQKSLVIWLVIWLESMFYNGLEQIYEKQFETIKLRIYMYIPKG